MNSGNEVIIPGPYEHIYLLHFKMRNCHSERSEGSLEFKLILPYIQDDRFAF